MDVVIFSDDKFAQDPELLAYSFDSISVPDLNGPMKFNGKRHMRMR